MRAKVVQQIQSRTVTNQLLSGTFSKEAEGDIRADEWFEYSNSERYYVRESCFRTGDASAMTILWWEDEKQLIDIEEEEERRAARRSDFRSDD